MSKKDHLHTHLLFSHHNQVLASLFISLKTRENVKGNMVMNMELRNPPHHIGPSSEVAGPSPLSCLDEALHLCGSTLSNIPLFGPYLYSMYGIHCPMA